MIACKLPREQSRIHASINFWPSFSTDSCPFGYVSKACMEISAGKNPIWVKKLCFNVALHPAETLRHENSAKSRFYDSKSIRFTFLKAYLASMTRESSHNWSLHNWITISLWNHMCTKNQFLISDYCSPMKSLNCATGLQFPVRRYQVKFRNYIPGR
jgi:hypothetical protein